MWLYYLILSQYNQIYYILSKLNMLLFSFFPQLATLITPLSSTGEYTLLEGFDLK